MPDHLRAEASAASRWLLAAATDYGIVGAVARSVGLFDILHSPLFLIPLAALIVVLLVQIAQQTQAAFALRRLPTVLTLPGSAGEPLPVYSAQPLLRWRGAVVEPTLTIAGQVQMLLEARFGRAERRTVRTHPALLPATEGDSGSDSGHDGAAQTVLEERLLALRGQQTVLLRPLLLTGMLCAALYLWVTSVMAWHYAAPFMVPGAPAVDAVHGLQLQYELTEPFDGVLAPSLRIMMDGESALAPLGAEMRAQVAGVDVAARSVAPALHVRAMQGTAELARPGQATTVNALGLGFPTDGSEETVLLPKIGAGLRIVRNGQDTPSADDDIFLVEVYGATSEQPLRRFEVRASQVETIRANGAGTAAVTLAFVPLPVLAVEVRAAPGQWLLVMALVLALVGLLGFRQQPGFVLVQLGPWPEQRTVMVLQSDLPNELAALRRWREDSDEVRG